MWIIKANIEESLIIGHESMQMNKQLYLIKSRLWKKALGESESSYERANMTDIGHDLLIL